MAHLVLIILIFCSCFCVKFSVGHEIANLTESQNEAFELFKSFTRKFENRPAFSKTDLYLIRWLEACKYDVTTAQDKFNASIKWRQESKIDSLLAEDFPVSIQIEFPFTVNSLDKLGRPVAYSPTGLYNFRKMALKGQTNTMTRFGISCLELMEVYSYELQCSGNWTSGVRPQFTLVVDVAGGSLWNSACFNCLTNVPEYVSVYEKYYPEMILRAIMFNIPRLMVAVFNTLRAFMSQATQDAIHVYGYDKEEYGKALLEIIPPDQIPTQYGGTKNYTAAPNKKDAQTWNWNNPVLEKIFEDARANISFQKDNCNPRPNSIPDAIDAIKEVINDENRQISTTTPSKPEHHRHRHGHGLDHHERSTPKPEPVSHVLHPNFTDQVHHEDNFFTDNELETNVINTDISKNDAEHFRNGIGSNINEEAEESATIVPGSCEKDCETHTVLTSNTWNNFDDDFLFDNTPEEKSEPTTAYRESNVNRSTKLDFHFSLPIFLFILQMLQ